MRANRSQPASVRERKVTGPGATHAKLFRPTARNLQFLAGRLRAGQLVAAPTETVYGLAANALDENACRKIFAAKRRPSTDPLIVHVASLEQLELVSQPNASAQKLADRFWPGPLTMILPKTDLVPRVVSAGRDSVAVRMPAHPLFRRLLRLTGKPLAAPSANPFGYVSPTTAAHVADGLGRRIRYILDGGATDIGLESTIVDLRDESRPVLLRPGAIDRGQLERALKKPVALAGRSRAAGSSRRAQVAPGLMNRHYSPHTPIVLHRRLPSGVPAPGEAWVFFRRPAGQIQRDVYWLDAQGDPRGAARHLFALIRKLDRARYARLHIELAPGAGLADAINDRLRRAAAR